MREIPSFRLEKDLSEGAFLGVYNLVASGSVLQGLILGSVYKDAEMGHSGLNWHGWTCFSGGDAVDLGFFRTRQHAMLAVAKKWQAIEDEREAHDINEGSLLLKRISPAPPTVTLLTSLDWERRVKELAEELGRAQAHAIPKPHIHFRNRDDGELLEEAVFALRSLRRQQQKDHFDADTLRTAAFAYQFVLNAAHDRALCDEGLGLEPHESGD